MSVWFAALLLALAIAATYLVCVRPMRRGECGMAATPRDRDVDKHREIAELRGEIARLRDRKSVV